MRLFWLLLFYGLIYQPALALEPVTLQLKWHHQFQFAGYYAAKAQGYYADAGLDVTILPSKKGLDPVARVMQGDAQYGVGSSNLLLARHAGQAVVVLAVIFQHSPYILLAKQRTDINSIHDLVGKRIMLEPQTEELVAYLNKEGIKIDSMILQSHSLKLQSLINGDTDVMSAYITDEPYQLDLLNIPHQFFTPRAAGIDFYGDNLFTSQQQIDQHPEQVKAFREASLHGWRYALEHPDDVIDEILLNYPTVITRQQLQYEATKMRSLIHPELIELGYMLPGRWQHIAETYEALSMLSTTISLDGFLYNPNPIKDLSPLYIGLAIILLILSIIALVAWRFFRLNKRLDHLLYIKDRHANIGEAVNNISHQWKQPLNNLGFQLMRIEQSLMMAGNNRDVILELLEKSNHTLQFMADTTDSFRDFLSANPIITRFNPATAINETLAILDDSFALNNIVINTQLADDIRISATKTELSHVFLSILVNARSIFTERKTAKPAISIVMVKVTERVTITISDNAGGISIKPIHSIFSLGVSSHTHSRREGDAGIGLFIAQKIITEKFNGTISVSNNTDGAVFTITLPLN